MIVDKKIQVNINLNTNELMMLKLAIKQAIEDNGHADTYLKFYRELHQELRNIIK